MESRKSVILIGENEVVSRQLFEAVMAQYPHASLRFFSDGKQLLRQQKENKIFHFAADELLLILNIYPDIKMLEETLSAIANDKRICVLPVIVLLAGIDKEILRLCYEKYISGTVLIPDKSDEKSIKFVLENTLNFWLNIASLPKCMADNADTLRKSLQISDGIESKLKSDRN